MRRLSAIRFRELRNIEAKRGPLMDGMIWLMHAHAHLKKESPSPENLVAMEQIGSTVGVMEDTNKSLAEKCCELWQAILALDGPELSHPQIAEQQQAVEKGIEWLDRIRKRLALNLLAWDSREESLMAISELESQLYRLRRELGTAQENHQMAQAEAMMRPYPSGEN